MTTTTQTVPARLAGRCWNGAERDSGRVYHAVPTTSTYYGRALCWVQDADAAVTCPRCLKAAKR